MPGLSAAININFILFLMLPIVEDITSPPSQLFFDVGQTSACTPIQTQNDTVYEDNEQLMLSLTTTNPSISISVGSTTVEITDNDRKDFLQSV